MTIEITISAPGTRGSKVKIRGIVAKGATLVSNDGQHIVIKTKGYSENGGSRHSGIISYYPSETQVWRIVDEREGAWGQDFQCEAVTSWATSPHPK